MTQSIIWPPRMFHCPWVAFYLSRNYDDTLVDHNICRKLLSAKRYMLLSRRCGLSNLKSHRISGRMLGSSSRQPKEGLKRCVGSHFCICKLSSVALFYFFLFFYFLFFIACGWPEACIWPPVLWPPSFSLHLGFPCMLPACSGSSLLWYPSMI